MNQQTVRYGIVGLNHGRGHIEAAAKQPHIRVAAVCDANPHLLEPYRQRGFACHTDYAHLLRDPQVDAVVIATPAHLHAPMTLQALAAGKHVFLEKPVGSNLAEILQLKHAADARPQLKVQIGFEFQSSPFAQEIKRVMDAGQLGRVHQIAWTCYHPKFYAPEFRWKITRQGGGPLFDESSHAYNLWNHLLGSRFTRVCAMGGIDFFNDPHREVEDNGVVVFEYENKARVMYGFVEFLDQPYHTHFEIVGTAGKLRADMADGGSFVMYTGKDHRRTEFRVDPTTTNPGHLGFDEQHAHFARSILEDRPSFVPLDSGIEAYVMALAALRSIERGAIVTRDEILRPYCV